MWGELDVNFLRTLRLLDYKRDSWASSEDAGPRDSEEEVETDCPLEFSSEFKVEHSSYFTGHKTKAQRVTVNFPGLARSPTALPRACHRTQTYVPSGTFYTVSAGRGIPAYFAGCF